MASAPKSLGFTGVLANHSQGVALVNGENRKAAATGLPREVHHRRAQNLDQPFQRPLSLRIVGELQGVSRTDEIAPVEGGQPDAMQRTGDQFLQSVQSIILDENPEEVLGVGVTLIFQPFLGEVAIHFCAIFGVPQAVVGLAHDALAGAADGHDGQVPILRHRKGAGVQGVAQELVLFLQDASARAGRTLHLPQVNPQALANQHGRRIQLGTAAPGHAPGERKRTSTLVSLMNQVSGKEKNAITSVRSRPPLRRSGGRVQCLRFFCA